MCEALTCQPGWSYTPYEKQKCNPSFQSCFLKKVCFVKTKAVPHLLEALLIAKKRARNRAAGFPTSTRPRWKSQQMPNRVIKYWKRFCVVLRLFIQPRSHPTRSAGSPSAHAHFQKHIHVVETHYSQWVALPKRTPSSSFQNRKKKPLWAVRYDLLI